MPQIQGIAYPLTIADGQLITATDADLVRQQIFSVLETRPHERVMRPRYGMPDLLFSAIVPGILGVAIQQALAAEIRQGVFEVALVDYDYEGGFEVEVRWSLSGIPQPPINFEYGGKRS
jgi:phage baseplate assembly protein W